MIKVLIDCRDVSMLLLNMLIVLALKIQSAASYLRFFNIFAVSTYVWLETEVLLSSNQDEEL